MLENLDKIMHLRFNFDACPMHSPFGFVHLTVGDVKRRLKQNMQMSGVRIGLYPKTWLEKKLAKEINAKIKTEDTEKCQKKKKWNIK